MDCDSRNFVLTEKQAAQYWEKGDSIFVKDVDNENNTILVSGADNKELSFNEMVNIFIKHYNVKNVAFSAVMVERKSLPSRYYSETNVNEKINYKANVMFQNGNHLHRSGTSVISPMRYAVMDARVNYTSMLIYITGKYSKQHHVYKD